MTSPDRLTSPDPTPLSPIETIEMLLLKQGTGDIDLELFTSLGLGSIASYCDGKATYEGPMKETFESALQEALCSEAALKAHEYGRSGGTVFSPPDLTTQTHTTHLTAHHRLKMLFQRVLPSHLNAKVFKAARTPANPQNLSASGQTRLTDLYSALDEAHVPMDVQSAFSVELVLKLVTKLGCDIVLHELEQVRSNPQFMIIDGRHYFATIIHRNFNATNSTAIHERSLNFYRGYRETLSAASSSAFIRLYGEQHATLAQALWSAVAQAQFPVDPNKLAPSHKATFKYLRQQVFRALGQAGFDAEQIKVARNLMRSMRDTFGDKTFSGQALEIIDHD